MHTKSFFSTDVSEYMQLNGFTKLDTKGMHDGMIWRKDKIAVQFWQNRIEMHVFNALGEFKLTNTYTGFDGHNIQHLIMLLHCMGAITIQSANELANKQTESSGQLEKIFLSMPVMGAVRSN